MVSMVAFQAVDPGSIPGRRIFFSFKKMFLFLCSFLIHFETLFFFSLSILLIDTLQFSDFYVLRMRGELWNVRNVGFVSGVGNAL